VTRGKHASFERKGRPITQSGRGGTVSKEIEVEGKSRDLLFGLVVSLGKKGDEQKVCFSTILNHGRGPYPKTSVLKLRGKISKKDKGWTEGFRKGVIRRDLQ